MKINFHFLKRFLSDRFLALRAIKADALQCRKGQFSAEGEARSENRREKASDNAVERKDEEWQRTFDAIPDLLFIQDKNYTINKVNKACLDYLRCGYDDIIGKKCYQVLHNAEHCFPGCPGQMTLQDQAIHTAEIFDAAIGQPLLITTSPIFDVSGEFVGTIHLAKDVSVIKETEQQLMENLDQLRKFQEATIDREIRMIDLKREINRLNKELGRSAPYDLTFAGNMEDSG